jgi:hypothetical protein
VVAAADDAPELDAARAAILRFRSWVDAETGDGHSESVSVSLFGEVLISVLRGI